MNKDVILFYKVSDDYGCFSNWFLRDFSYAGITYISSEQYMMYQKAIIFDDQEVALKILNETDQLKIKRLGREVRNFDEHIWSRQSFAIMRRGLRAKFLQNPDLLQILLSTEDKMIAEAAPRDRIWGIGMGKSNPNALNPSLWRGKNMLGKVLMKVRDDIRMILNNIDYIYDIDYSYHLSTSLWDKSIRDLYKINDLVSSLEAFVTVIPQNHVNSSFFDLSFQDIENYIHEHHIISHLYGFYELKRDIYELDTFHIIKITDDFN